MCPVTSCNDLHCIGPVIHGNAYCGQQPRAGSVRPIQSTLEPYGSGRERREQEIGKRKLDVFTFRFCGEKTDADLALFHAFHGSVHRHVDEPRLIQQLRSSWVHLLAGSSWADASPHSRRLTSLDWPSLDSLPFSQRLPYAHSPP